MGAVKTPFLGQAYVGFSKTSADNKLINLFPEVVPADGGGKEIGVFYRCPGLKLRGVVGTGPIRGLYFARQDLYVVSGNALYRVDTTLTVFLIGTITGTGPVSMTDNGIQVFVSALSNGSGYIYNSNTMAFAPIADPDFPGSGTVCFLDGYFVFNQPNTQKIWITSLYDGTSINPLDFASAEASPDNVVALATSHDELWCFGTNTTQVFTNTGDADFPLQPLKGVVIEYGCVAAPTVCKLDNTLFWLSQNDQGFGQVVRANGYTPQRISTHYIENTIRGYSTISDAIAYSYQQNGHAFYVISFPTGNQTFAYDVATGEWHERAYFNPINSQFERHRGQNHAVYLGNIHLVGDYGNGNIYQLDPDTFTDNGNKQKWLRTWRALPAGTNNLNKVFHRKLQIDAEMGVGLSGAPGADGVDPQMVLRWSDDGGFTWSNEHWRSMGALGKYKNRAIWRLLGSSRDRVYELSGTDSVKTALLSAQLDIEQAAA